MASREHETNGDLPALGRIITLIKAYRYQTDDHQILTRNQALDAYLKPRLSVHEWALWQRLSEPEREILRVPPVDEA